MFSARTIACALFAAGLLASAPAHAVADDLPLESLSLVGIITGDTPRAMLVDPSQRGWVVKRGDLVGRTGGGPSCRWRVVDIHDDAVLFVRNEPRCAAPVKTKTLTLAH